MNNLVLQSENLRKAVMNEIDKPDNFWEILSQFISDWDRSLPSYKSTLYKYGDVNQEFILYFDTEIELEKNIKENISFGEDCYSSKWSLEIETNSGLILTGSLDL
jgi:hypothetical protein